MELRDIIQATYKAYRNATTYQDTGTIEKRTKYTESESFNVESFQTIFDRDLGFAFQYYRNDDIIRHAVYAVFHKGLIFKRIATVSHSRDESPIMEDYLSDVLCTFSAVTSHLTTTVPLLLLNLEEESTFRLRPNMRRISDAVMDGEKYFRIEWNHYTIEMGGVSTHLIYWINQHDYLIYLIESTKTFEVEEIGFERIDERFYFYPELDKPVNLELLEVLQIDETYKGVIQWIGPIFIGRSMWYVSRAWEHDKPLVFGILGAIFLFVYFSTWFLRRYILSRIKFSGLYNRLGLAKKYSDTDDIQS